MSYIIRRFVCNIPTNQLNKIFPPLYKQIANRYADDLVSGLKEVLQLQGYPKDDEFYMQLGNIRLYGEGERREKARFILESLELYQSGKESVNLQNLTIEHIMPQTLTIWWQQSLGEDWENTYELLLHVLGNLTLTGYNSELSNAPFPEKKINFASSRLALNDYFATTVHWGKNEIESRSEYLANLALEIWPYFGKQDAKALSSRESITGTKPYLINILGQNFNIKSWSQLWIVTLTQLAQIDSELFEEFANKYSRYIGRKNTFRNGRNLENGFYTETNLSAREIHRLCSQAFDAVGLSREDWYIEVE